MSPTSSKAVNVSNAVLNTVLAGVKEDLGELKGTMRSMAESLGKLTTIEARQSDQSIRIGQSFDEMAKLTARVSDVEIAMPGLKELRRWVVAGMVAGVGMMFVAVFSLVLYHPQPIYVTVPGSDARLSTSTQTFTPPAAAPAPAK